MLSLKLNTANRFIGSLLLVSLGVLVTLMFLTFKGSAVPAGKATLMVDLFNPSSTTTVLTIQELERPYPPAITIVRSEGSVAEGDLAHKPNFRPVHLYSSKWQEQPIRYGTEVAAGVTAALCLLYIGSKFFFRNLSKEVFP
jgi:hypothetical protein